MAVTSSPFTPKLWLAVALKGEVQKGTHPTDNGQDHLSHKGAEQAHKGNASQDGKDPGRVLAGSLGNALELAAMMPALLHGWACH